MIKNYTRLIELVLSYGQVMYEAGRSFNLASSEIRQPEDLSDMEFIEARSLRKKATEKWLDSIQQSRALMSELMAFDFTSIGNDWREKKEEIA